MEKHLSATGQELKADDLVELIDGAIVKIEGFCFAAGDDRVIYAGRHCPCKCVVLV